MINTETQSILKIAYPIFTSEVQTPGDFKNRSVDTRTKKRPSEADIGSINEAIGELLTENSTIDQARNPFGWLCMASKLHLFNI